MHDCTGCSRSTTEEEFVVAWGQCRDCVRERQARVLSNYVVAMSEQVVETPFGWCTALCGLGDPIGWLCWHIHHTKDGASTCLDQSLADGRGRFPVR
jgi:hypothetical protein